MTLPKSFSRNGRNLDAFALCNAMAQQANNCPAPANPPCPAAGTPGAGVNGQTCPALPNGCDVDRKVYNTFQCGNIIALTLLGQVNVACSYKSQAGHELCNQYQVTSQGQFYEYGKCIYTQTAGGNCPTCTQQPVNFGHAQQNAGIKVLGNCVDCTNANCVVDPIMA